MTEGPFTPSPLVLELERKLQAKEKTISLLTQRVDDLSRQPRPSLPVLEQTVMLEQILAQRDEQLETQHVELSQTLSELRQAQSQLLHSQKLEAIGSLAAGIAHEINTPAQFVSDNTSFLKKSFSRLTTLLESYRALVDDLERGNIKADRATAERERIRVSKLGFLLEEIPNALDGAQEGLHRISSIVRAMKEFSHPSNGVPQQVDLREIINTTVTVTRNEWKYVADLETEFDPELPAIPCLRDELSQVFVNLIVNAAHAIGTTTQNGSLGKGIIRISTHASHGCAEIRVSDNGCGIPESIRHRVFEPFFTTKPVGSGTGQGLAIAYSVIVDKHGGEILLSSTEGQGTTFTLYLPLAGSDDRRAESSGEAL